MYWRAKYANGVTVTEEDGVSSDQVNRTMLEELSVMDGALPVYTIQLDGNKRHFYRKRTAISPGGKSEIIHLMGFKDGNSWHIAAIHENHSVDLTDSFNKADWRFYPPKFLPREELG